MSKVLLALALMALPALASGCVAVPAYPGPAVYAPAPGPVVVVPGPPVVYHRPYPRRWYW